MYLIKQACLSIRRNKGRNILGNLDKETENEIMKIFTRLAHEEGKCVIIVTHSDNVSNQCDKVYELKTKK